jgi:3-hydroxyacyl-CoA dehydrogenase
MKAEWTMSYSINRVVVIGAGTMGASIAAMMANVGLPCTLLDIVPTELTDDEAARGLTLEDPAVRNRIVTGGLERCARAKPANFYVDDFVQRVRTGNLEDDFDAVGQADLVIEAIVERLDIKRQLMARVEKARRPGTIVTTNTSGIPIHQIAEGFSEEFQSHFLGTHFFNPPRYLKLLEIIPHSKNSPELLEFMGEFCTRVFGKGVVWCKDTPNFIANRMLSIAGSEAINYALDHDYTVEEVDAMTGPAIGRPKTATFRLNDLVGIDVLEHVSRNLYEAIPHDPHRGALRHPKASALIGEMVKRGWLGNKSGQGFYKKTLVDGDRQFWVLNPETLEYEPPTKVKFDSIEAGRAIDDLGERLAMLAYADDRAGEYLWHLLSRLVVYAASCVPEISDNIYSIDNACCWGFGWQMGPFQIWDAIGLERSIERLMSEGVEIPAWVEAMIAGGTSMFYRKATDGQLEYYDMPSGGYRALPIDPDVIQILDLKAQGREVEANDSASLIDMGDGVLLFEFHSKANAMDEDIYDMGLQAIDLLKEDRWVGMVIGNQGRHYCAGANIFTMAVAAQQGDFDLIDAGLHKLQGLLQSIRFSPKPVVAAPFGMTLGGGCEMVMASSRVVASAETYIGLVEMGVGVIPAGTGTKEIVRRVITPPMRTPNALVVPFLQQAFEQIGLAKVATSAEEARKMKILSERDRIVINQDHLLSEAKKTVLEMAPAYRAPLPERIYAAGRDAMAALEVALFQLQDGSYATEHDVRVGRQLAKVLCGGDLSAGEWVSEDAILRLEREAFLALCHEPKTIERMWYMLQNNKPLRN